MDAAEVPRTAVHPLNNDEGIRRTLAKIFPKPRPPAKPYGSAGGRVIVCVIAFPESFAQLRCVMFAIVVPCPLTWHRGRSLVVPCPLTWHRGRSLAVSAKVLVEAGALAKRNVAVIHRPPGALPPFQTFALTARCGLAALPKASLPSVALPWAMNSPSFGGRGMAFSHPAPQTSLQSSLDSMYQLHKERNL